MALTLKQIVSRRLKELGLGPIEATKDSGLERTFIRDIVEGPSTKAAVPGNNVVLTLDAEVQRIAERALRPAAAAGAVVMDVGTGRLLAMVSKPAFDPNEMSGHLTP